MGHRVDPNWIKDKKEEIGRGKFISVTLTYNPAAQWLIRYLADRDQPVKVTALGAGVKRITVAEHICPTCKGKGFVGGRGSNLSNV